MKARVVPAAFVTAVFALFGACSNGQNQGSVGLGDGGDSSIGDDGNGEPTASITLALAGFSGDSVQICGSRPAVDGKVRCASNLSQIAGAAAVVPPPDAGDAAAIPDAGDAGAPLCLCFDFAADGSLMDSTGNPVVINGLCPSTDLGADASDDAGPVDWTFTYSIFTSPKCMGTQLNDGTHNFTCFDSHDLNSHAHPNESVEVLNPGLNENHVICATTIPPQTFATCASSCDTPEPDGGCAQTRFSCGCTVEGTDGGAMDAGATCICGDAGFTAANLPAGCQFDPTTCDILCM